MHSCCRGGWSAGGSSFSWPESEDEHIRFGCEEERNDGEHAGEDGEEALNPSPAYRKNERKQEEWKCQRLRTMTMA